MPRVGLTNPGLWNPRNDEWDRYLTGEKKHATRDEYRHLMCYGGAEDRLAYLRRFKCKKALTGEERVAERLVYSRFFDTTAAERSNDGVDASSTPWTTTDSRSASTRRPRRRPPRSSKSAAAEGAEAAAAATSASRSRRQRPEHADRATKERADKNKDKDKIKGKPQPGNPARKTTTPRTEEQN
eukprot:jgi/Tetstr1/432878/TSEL_022227.t1